MNNITKRTTVFCLLALILFSFGCEKATVNKEYYDDGSLMSEYSSIGHTIQGESKIFYRNGKIWEIKEYRNGEIISGKDYYQTGELESVYPYADGEIHGIVKHFYKNKTLKVINTYKDGVADGLEEHYYQNGSIFIESYRKKFPQERYGFFHGRTTVFAKTGEAIASGIFIYGNPWTGTFTSAKKEIFFVGRKEKYLLEYDKGKLINVSELKTPVVKLWKFSDKEIAKRKKDSDLKLKKLTMPKPIIISINNGEHGRKFQIDELVIKDKKLCVNITYLGGQKDHKFKIIWNGQYSKTSPPDVRLKLIDITKEDRNHATVAISLYFNIENLKTPVNIIVSNNFGEEKTILLTVLDQN